MTNDQHRIGQLEKARILIADAFDRDRAADTKPNPHDLAVWLLDQLRDLGWRPPLDPTDVPPLRPTRPGRDDGPGRRAFREAREALANRRTSPANPPTP